jgi:hypothetical protein
MPKAPDHPTTTKLPPPPAPVARDANPWPMPEQQGGAPRPSMAQRREVPQSPSELLIARQRNPAPDPVRSSRHGLSRFVPVAVFLAILGSIAASAFESLGRGDRLGAIIPLVVIGVAAISVWRSARRRRNRSPGVGGGGQAGR